MSEKQDRASEFALNSEKEIYIDAVCGAGKTEIVFKSIEDSISKGNRVGFAIPRREVAYDIYQRLKEVFPSLNVILVYGGHSEFLDGDIIVLTCHQCYRYKNKFGLLIVDEYDAFPLKGDQTLLNIVKKSTYDKTIFLSATFTKNELLGKKVTSIKRRYHNYDIPVPKIIKTSHFLMLFKIIIHIKQLQKSNIFLFVPTIRKANFIYKVLRIFFHKTKVLTSNKKHSNISIDEILKSENNLVVCTTILERGITLRNLNIIVYQADHFIFDFRTLIQIAGRAGRKKSMPKGEILFVCNRVNQDIKYAIESIVNKNNGFE